MAKPNYAFQKRQKEIAKKKKKEEKRLKKTGVDDNQPQDVQSISENDDNQPQGVQPISENDDKQVTIDNI